ncbi:MAG: holo-ACP synthase [Acidimicrobiia bacterium]
MIVGLGTDVVEVERFRLALQRRATLADRIFTNGEREYGAQQHDPAESLAARFAAKEAVMKALGVGLGDFEFHDVEVVRAASGAPSLVLTGKAEAIAAERGVVAWHVSLSHTTSAAIAVVIAIGT